MIEASLPKGKIVMKLNEARYLGAGRIAVLFSDGSQGIFDARARTTPAHLPRRARPVTLPLPYNA
ncbi:hypothetical protein BDD21_2634 [Thiocapsa rosea]|uniref:Uncharacterized protein n=2 Tax=Thiocapsa rosea TaxID=69360 RepID=A0A495V9S7_9GAMM|nr:hypothetical protein BDD21_2634 [Thiocapsa rosea]